MFLKKMTSFDQNNHFTKNIKLQNFITGHFLQEKSIFDLTVLVKNGHFLQNIYFLFDHFG